MEVKTCTRCKKEIINTYEFFVVDKRNPDGLGAICRICEKARTKEYYSKYPGKSKEYRESHKKQLSKQRHEHYLNTIEQRKKSAKEYYNNNKESIYKRATEWKKNNPDKLTVSSHKRYEKIKEHHKQLTRNWKQSHKDKRNISWQARRSKKLSLECSLTQKQWIGIMDYFDNKCCYCGRKLQLTQDHFVPLSSLGAYSKENIVPSCQSCNSSKSVKSFSNWYPLYKFYSPERERKIIQYIELMQTASQV